MEEYDTRILVDAKVEYTKYFIRILKKHFFEGISSLYDTALEQSQKNYNQVFLIFQDLLSQIPKWNQNTIDDETQRIIECAECEFLEDLLTAVFISHTKILSVIRINKKNKKINLNIPKLNNFIHKCYIEIAREFWKTPTYFNNNIPSTEIQKNYRICEEIISNCINETIRKLLPIKYILKESLGDDYDDDDSIDSEDIQKGMSKTEEKNLRKLVQKEVENVYKKTNNSDSKLKVEDDTDIQIPSKNNFSDNSSNPNIENKSFEDDNYNNINDLNLNNNLLEEKINDNNIIDNNSNIDNHKISTNTNLLEYDTHNYGENKLTDSKYNNLKEDDELLSINHNDVNKLSEKKESDIYDSKLTNSTISIDTSNQMENKPVSNNHINKKDIKDISINPDYKSIDNEGVSFSDNDLDELNELDISMLSSKDSVVNLDNNYNIVADQNSNIYKTLNQEKNIKSEVLDDLNKNKKNEFTFFEDAIEIENI